MATNSSDEPTPGAATFGSLVGLPAGHVVWTWSRMERLQVEAEAIQENLTANEGTGNQWLVVLGLTKKAIEKLASHENGLRGIAYRFQWEGTVGIIKIIPGYSHECPTQDFAMAINDQLAAMGVRRNDRTWGGGTTYSPTCNTGKEANEIFTPFNRRPFRGIVDWPTLVIETGARESYRKLQEDVRWWFDNSSGRVRIAIVIIVHKDFMRFEQWQLVPHDTSTPLTRRYSNQSCPQVPNVSWAAQPVHTQRPYSAQEVLITPDSVTGAPMIIPFEALYDRGRGPTETDVILTADDFRDFASTSF